MMAKEIFLFGLLASIWLNAVDSAPTAVGPSAKPATTNSAGDNNNNNPLQNMFRSFGQFIPPQAYQGIPDFGGQIPFSGGNYPQFPFDPNNFGQQLGQQFAQQFIPGPYQTSPTYGGYPPTTTMGFSGPYGPTGNYGQPNPAYGNFGGGGGNVPVVTTRLNQPGYQPGSSTIYTNNDQVHASVSVQGGPGQGPQFRSQTVQGPNSQGTAYAYSSG